MAMPLTLMVELAQQGREVETGLAVGLNIGPLGVGVGVREADGAGRASWSPLQPGTAGTNERNSDSPSARHALPVWAEVAARDRRMRHPAAKTARNSAVRFMAGAKRS